MTTTAKSFVAAFAVLAATGSILAGAIMRDRVDVGGANVAETLPVTGLVASRNPREVPEGDYFYEITNLLKKRYVEPITDERKLAIGAVRGMVMSLGDPDSVFMDKDLFPVHQAMREGEFQGIGAQLELIYTVPKEKDARETGQPVEPEEALLGSIRIPKLTVVTVVPGGPADRAGVKAGDYVEYVDDHWVPNSETVASYRKMQRDFNDGKVSWEQLSKVQQELTNRTKKTFMPSKAREKLLVGEKGNTKVVWKRGTDSRTTVIEKGLSRMPEFAVVDDVVHLRFSKDGASEFKHYIAGQSEAVIDLRGNANGLAGPMRECLEAILPKGTYGKLKFDSREIPFEVKTGNPNPPKLTLLVDKTTRGAAEVFFQVLELAGVAKTTGGPTAGHPILVEDYSLPDGSGYSLAIAQFKGAAK